MKFGYEIKITLSGKYDVCNREMCNAILKKKESMEVFSITIVNSIDGGYEIHGVSRRCIVRHDLVMS